MDPNDVIFVRRDGALRRLERSSYQTEDVFQQLLAEHPDLLPGSLIRPDDPVSWLFVCREVGIADRHEGASRWSVDLLLLDQHAIPTLVEVKRRSDTRIRREVVGQMLDYAANATAYWPVHHIRQLVQAQFDSDDSVRERVERLIGRDDDLETYWARVEANLRDGRVRLLFVADEIPAELRSIIEFLNRQMTTAEVLGVEVGRYLDGDTEAFVPRLVGQSQQALEVKDPGTPRRPMSMSAFLDATPTAARPVFQRLLTDAPAHGAQVVWNSRSFSLRLRDMTLLYGYPPGTLDGAAPTIAAYVGNVPELQRTEIRSRFQAAAPFRVSGKYTLVLPFEGPSEAVDGAIAELWRVLALLRDAPS